MLWKEVRSWATQHGYKTSKIEGGYSWYRISDPSIEGLEKSVSKLAKAIYNDITCNKFIDHQADYVD